MNSLSKAQVRAPCSTSNLGSGFDTLGLALDRHLRATFEPGGSELELVRTGTLSVLEEEPERDLLAMTFDRFASEGDASPHGILRVHSDIPLKRGLGSSAAALVAGHDLALAALGRPSDPVAAFRYASHREGHGDNAAPCALGGFRAVVPSSDGPRPLALELSRDVGFAYAAPGVGLGTPEARAALPRHVPHHTAVAALGRLAALLRGLALGDPELIRVGVEDELHVPHRLPLIPGAFSAISAGYDAGAWGVTISGSGSGLLALCAVEDAPGVASAMRTAFALGAGEDSGCVGFELRPDFDGVARIA
ncbi:MAG TPA: homoserine kinase [Longimicrobiales bacterium]|nr:homoserine kinase [Longimicrobiales bacterium]